MEKRTINIFRAKKLENIKEGKGPKEPMQKRKNKENF